MTHPHSLTKFRPVLTLQQIQHIAYHFQQLPQDTIGQSIVKVMIPMIAKVEVGAISPAYKLSETHLIKQLESARRIAYESGTMSSDEVIRYEAEILGL